MGTTYGELDGTYGATSFGGGSFYTVEAFGADYLAGPNGWNFSAVPGVILSGGVLLTVQLHYETTVEGIPSGSFLVPVQSVGNAVKTNGADPLLEVGMVAGSYNYLDPGTPSTLAVTLGDVQVRAPIPAMTAVLVALQQGDLVVAAAMLNQYLAIDGYVR